MNVTPFNPEGKQRPTYGDLLNPIAKITEQADADQYKREYIRFIERELARQPRTDGMTAEQIVNANVGYWAGYFDRDTQRRVERLFKTTHPIFGETR